MYVLTSEIFIDKERSKEYNEIFIKGGSFKGDKVIGFVNDSIIQIDCNKNSDIENINIYLDVFRRSFILEYKEINEDLSVGDLVHIGGALVKCNNGRKSLDSFIEKEDPCLQYKRGLDSSFSVDFFGKQEVINVCESFKKEFTESFNTDYNINERGDGIILDCRIYGDLISVDGNTDLVDGNEPRPDCSVNNPGPDCRIYGNDTYADGDYQYVDGNEPAQSCSTSI